ncbi:MAG: hypothetical protein RSC99_09110 [Clostridiales bacterium]
MIKLINIKRNDKFIEAEYLPENSKEKGYIKIELESGEVIESKRSPYEDEYYEHFSQAKRELKRLAKEKELPKESLVMWY